MILCNCNANCTYVSGCMVETALNYDSQAVRWKKIRVLIDSMDARIWTQRIMFHHRRRMTEVAPMNKQDAPASLQLIMFQTLHWMTVLCLCNHRVFGYNCKEFCEWCDSTVNPCVFTWSKDACIKCNQLQPKCNSKYWMYTIQPATAASEFSISFSSSSQTSSQSVIPTEIRRLSPPPHLILHPPPPQAENDNTIIILIISLTISGVVLCLIASILVLCIVRPQTLRWLPARLRPNITKTQKVRASKKLGLQNATTDSAVQTTNHR